MTQSEPPTSARWKEVPQAPSMATDLSRAVPVALRRGFTVAIAAVLLGQLVPLAVNLNGAGLAIVTQLRLGWLYTVATNAVSIRIDGISESAGETLLGGAAMFRLAALTFTGILLWMLVRAGAAAARTATDLPVRRAVAGALVGIPYAAPLFVLALFVDLRLRTGGGFLPDVTTFSALVSEMLVFAVSFGMVAGAFGGLHSTTWWHGRAGQVLAAGWRTFWVALSASLIGLLAFAALRPAGLDAYVQELRSLGVRGSAITTGHQVLLLPNQAALILVPAMSGCDTLTVDGDVSDVICLDRLPDAGDPVDWLATTVDDRPGSPTEDAPWSARLFLLVPLIAVVVGARLSASGSTSVGRAAGAALGSALVFAALVACITWASTVVVTTTNEQVGDVVESRRIELGAQPQVAGAYAMGWGVLIGVPTACAVVLMHKRRPNAGAS